jgi:lysophospholipase L1-like esterase
VRGAATSGLAALIALSALAVLSGCGGAGGSRATSTSTSTHPLPVAERSHAIVAALGDSITAGSPLWDPSATVRREIGPAINEQSQYEYWAQRLLGNYVRFRNCGVAGERTDEIAQRLTACAAGARYLIIQGGINDIAQGRPIAAAASDLRKMVQRGKQLGLRVGLAELLPWNNGYPSAAPLIGQLNNAIHAIGREEHVPVYSFFHALEDPSHPGRMQVKLTSDGDHPSVIGYRILGSLISLP